MSNFLTRGITGAVFVVMVIAALWFGKESTVALFSLFTFLGLIEFYQLFNQRDEVAISWKRASFIGMLTFAILASVSLEWISKIALYTLIPIHFLRCFWSFGVRKRTDIQHCHSTFGDHLYCGTFFLMVELNDNSNHSMPQAIGMFLLICTNDTFAFLTGKYLLEKNKLFERVSPKKTWEGTVGGGILTVVVATLLAFLQ